MLNDFSYDVKIWTDLSTILSQSTRLTDSQTDRQTDRILIARPRLHSMQRGKKTELDNYLTESYASGNRN